MYCRNRQMSFPFARAPALLKFAKRNVAMGVICVIIVSYVALDLASKPGKQYTPGVVIEKAVKMNAADFEMYLGSYHPTNEGETGFKGLIKHAETMKKSGTFPLVALVNKGYLSMTQSWLCNTAKMTGVHDRTIIIAADEPTLKELSQTWPSIGVFLVPIGDNLEEGFDFMTSGYVSIMVFRMEVIKLILEQGISLLLFEPDAVWYKNPLGIVESLRGQADIAGSTAGKYTDLISVNFMYFESTRATTESLKEVLVRLAVSKNDGEQSILSELCMRGYANVSCMGYPYDLIADGVLLNVWAATGYMPRRKIPQTANNNCISGTKRKIARAKSFGFWFLLDDYENSISAGKVCNWSRVDNFVNYDLDVYSATGRTVRFIHVLPGLYYMHHH